MPDLTGLDLKEGDKRWLAILAGDHDAYGGEAVNPRHVSKGCGHVACSCSMELSCWLACVNAPLARRVVSPL